MHRLTLLYLACVAGGAVRAMGQTATSTPHVFAPGSISGMTGEDCLSLTPDGNTAIYDIANARGSFIVEAHRVGGRWSRPSIASFSGTWVDHDPAVSPDGTFIVFASNRPASDGGKTGGGLWRVDRVGTGWGAPKRLPDVVNTSPRIYAPTIAKDGSVYFIRPGSDNVLHIFRSQYRSGTYEAPVQQAIGNPTEHQKDPGIAPDEGFVVFDAPDPAKQTVDRLYIAFREGDHWGKEIDLGDSVNANNNPWGSHVGRDGTTLYYTTDRSVPVSYPRSREQRQADFTRLETWDNGETNIWYLSLERVIAEHARSKG